MKKDSSADTGQIQKEDPNYAGYAKMGIVCTAFHNYRMESPIFRLYWNLKQWGKNLFPSL